MVSATQQDDLRLGVRLPVAGPLAGRDSIRTVALQSERLGYDDIWLHDYLTFSRVADETHISCGSAEAVDAAGPDAPPQFFESLTTLAFLAGVTERIGIGVSVLVLPWRNPVIAAKQVATIDVLSGGRLTLGIGVGGNRESHTKEFEVLGIERREKYARSREILQSMRSLWTDKHPAYHGRFVNFDFAEEEAQLNPKPRGGATLPVLVGGAGPKSMAIAAELAEGWIPLWLSPDDYKHKVAELHRLAREAGRDPAQLRIGGTFPVLIDTSRERAWARADRTLRVIAPAFTGKLTVEQVRSTSLIGNPADFVTLFKQYMAAGVMTFELRFIYEDVSELLEQLQLLADEVMPHVKAPT